MIELSKEAREWLAREARIGIPFAAEVLAALDSAVAEVANHAVLRRAYEQERDGLRAEVAAKSECLRVAENEWDRLRAELSAANASAEAYRKAFDALKADFESETRRVCRVGKRSSGCGRP